MDSSIPPGVVGYCAVVVKDRDLWQGLFIREDDAPLHQQVLDGVRKALRSFEGPPGSIVYDSMPFISDADQPVAGVLSASLVETIGMSQHAHVMAFSGALRLLTGLNYFWIEAWHENKGIRTIFHPMPLVTSPEAARAFVNAIPEVQDMKSRTLNQAIDRHGKPRH
jgi:hypothetical protein